MATSALRPDSVRANPEPISDAPYRGNRAPIALLHALPPGPLAKKYRTLKRMARMFAPFDRNEMEMAVELLLAEMDEADGDTDVEHNGDSLDGSNAEDDFCEHNLVFPGPGCPVSDGGCSTDSGAGDPAWTEWHTRGGNKIGEHGEEVCRREDGIMAHEDDEDDDAKEADGDEQDGIGSEEDFMRHCYDGPGCPIADAGEHDDEGVGQCMTFGVNQTEGVGAIAAFHDLNGIPLIRVPHPAKDQVPA